MKRKMQLLGLLLAVLWAPITSHCAWEDVPAFSLLKCLDDAPEPDAGEGECTGDSCATVESASYKTSETHLSVPAPVFSVIFELAEAEAMIEKRAGRIFAEANAPPPITASWRFTLRAALPPRAPSVPS